MNKITFSLLVMVVASLAGSTLLAQSVEQGRSFYYYQRYKSARGEFEKVLASNPKNEDAIYWLGQTMIDDNDSAAARSLYAKALAENPNAPLVLVGVGQVELMDGKINEARQHFETAITISKGKDIDVLNAVGKANAHPKIKNGDANYAIEKLNQATAIKNFKNPETYILMGDAYRKLVDGGGAVSNYLKAFTLNDKLAVAKYKVGKIYMTQGNKDLFLPAFEQAVTIDPAYTPAYYELFYYWYFRDVNKAAPYLDKYVANADQGPETEYLKTDFLYASGKFGEAKAKAESLIAQYGDKVNPRMYRLVAYTADTLGDANAAKTAMNTFFSKANADYPVLGADYEELAKINSKIPGMEAEVFANLQKAADVDTLVENKLKYIAKAAALAKAKGDRVQEAKWLGSAYSLNPNPSQRDLYNYAFAMYQAKDYPVADSLFCGVYQTKYPDQIFGYLWCAKTKQAMDDSLNSQGLAVEAYKKVIAFADADTARSKYKGTLVGAHSYLATYYANIAKQKDSAIAHLESILEIDPANSDAPRFLKILRDSGKKETSSSAGKPSSQALKPATTGGGTAKK